MYWGDANMDKIETARIDGTGRRILGTERKNVNPHYFAFVLHDGDIYITDWKYKYVYIETVIRSPDVCQKTLLNFLFLFYQYTALSGRAKDDHKMYSGRSVAGKALLIRPEISLTSGVTRGSG